jgi:uncharacterized protein (DUF488 family)
MIYTIGHGSRSIGEFVELLRNSAIACVVDVRAYPASRRHPQFGREALEQSLGGSGIRYAWEGTALGGRRKPAKSSPHVALKDPAFQAFAGHMATAEFREGVQRLLGHSRLSRTAILCAERLPAECHRILISDYLDAIGEKVAHRVGADAVRDHNRSPEARLRDGVLIYDGAAQGALGL